MSKETKEFDSPKFIGIVLDPHNGIAKTFRGDDYWDVVAQAESFYQQVRRGWSPEDGGSEPIWEVYQRIRPEANVVTTQ